MMSWFTYLKNGLKRAMPPDKIAGKAGYSGYKANLRNLKPFFVRHMRKGIIGAVFVLLSTLVTFPPPLITRYITDDVILGKNLTLLAGAVILLIAVKLADKLFNVMQDYYFTRFEQEILLDIQQDLLDHTLKLPKSFFDEKETGYLMSRLSVDVQRLRWFFSSTLVYMLSQTIRFIGGAIFLFILEWRLALVVMVPIPVIIIGMTYFSRKTRILKSSKHGTTGECYPADPGDVEHHIPDQSFCIRKADRQPGGGSAQSCSADLTRTGHRGFRCRSGHRTVTEYLQRGGACSRCDIDHPRRVESGIASGVPGILELRLQPCPIPGFSQYPDAERSGSAGAGFCVVRHHPRGKWKRDTRQNTSKVLWN